MIDRLAIVGCGKSKQSRSCKARTMYRGALFQKSASYAERYSDLWLIASAKYGLLLPDTLIVPYDLTLRGKGFDFKRAWGFRCQADLVSIIGQKDIGTVLFLASRCYVEPLLEWTRLKRVYSKDLLRGLPIGKRLQWLSRALAD